jgi:hypothetical protein
MQSPALSHPDPKFQEDGSAKYKVKEVLAKWTTSSGVEYLVRWEGYGPEDDTWEPVTKLSNAKGVVQDFEAQGQATRRGGHHVMGTAAITLLNGKVMLK